MQAVAVGASLAYPLLRLARAIPLPVLMVGAGLFFAGSKTGQSATQKASDVVSDLSDEVVRRAREFGDQVGDSASAAKAYASDQFDRVSAAVSGGTDQVSRTADAAAATLSSNSKALQDRAASFGSTLSDRAADLREQGVRRAGSAAATVQDKVASFGSSLSDRATDLKDRGIRMAQFRGHDRPGYCVRRNICRPQRGRHHRGCGAGCCKGHARHGIRSHRARRKDHFPDD